MKKNILLLAALIIILGACRSSIEPIIATDSTTTPTALPTATATVAAPTATIATPTIATATASPTPEPTDILPSTPTATNTPFPIAEPTPFDRSLTPVRVDYPTPFGVEGSVAYFVQAGRLIVANLLDPVVPEILWRSEVLGQDVAGISVADSQAYITVDNELMIWDVENIQIPVLVGEIPVNGRVYFDPETARAYTITISDNQAQITTIDISDYSSPQELGTAVVQWSAGPFPAYYPFKIVHNHLFLVSDGFVEIIDLSDPNLSKLVATIAAPTNTNSTIEVADYLLYIVTASGTVIVDWRAIEGAAQIANYSYFSPYESIHVLGNRAYLFWQLCGWEVDDNDNITGGCGYGLEVVDVSEPVEPRHEGVIRLRIEDGQRWIDRTVQHGHLIYLESGINSQAIQLFVLDLSSLHH